MAISFVNYVDIIATAGTGEVAADLSAFSAGDYALVHIKRDSNSGPTAAPDGWSLLQSELSAMGQWVYGKLLGASDLTTHTWTWTSTTANTLAKAAVYSGCDGTSPVAASAAGTMAAASGGTVDCGSLSTASTWVVALGSCYSASFKSYSDLAGWTERRDNGSTSPCMWMLIADTNGSWAGGTCEPDFTLSSSAGYRVGFLVVLNAAAGSPAADYMTPLRGIW